MTEKEAYIKMLEINNTYNSFTDLGNPDYLNWGKALRGLQIALCDSKHWNELMNNIDLVELKRNKLWN